MKVLYHILDTIATNAAYLHAVETKLDLTNNYTQKTFRHSFISNLAVQLTYQQMQLSLQKSTHWSKQYHEQIFQAEKEISDRFLPELQRREDERKLQVSQSSHSNPLKQCYFCTDTNRVRIICSVCSKPVCEEHRIKAKRNNYQCFECNK
jgi:hypothetical protein